MLQVIASHQLNCFSRPLIERNAEHTALFQVTGTKKKINHEEQKVFLYAGERGGFWTEKMK